MFCIDSKISLIYLKTMVIPEKKFTKQSKIVRMKKKTQRKKQSVE